MEDISKLLPNFQTLSENEHNIQHKEEVTSSFISNVTSVPSTFSSECDSDIPEEYDLTMNFSPTKLGAKVDHISGGISCSICKFSMGSEFASCHSCFSVGHKHCFSEDLGTSHYYCIRSQCTRMLNQSKIWSVARRGQKRQAKKMLSDITKHFPLVSIGDNLRVTIPKVDRRKLGDKHILGVITEKSGISFYHWNQRRHIQSQVH